MKDCSSLQKACAGAPAPPGWNARSAHVFSRGSISERRLGCPDSISSHFSGEGVASAGICSARSWQSATAFPSLTNGESPLAGALGVPHQRMPMARPVCISNLRFPSGDDGLEAPSLQVAPTRVDRRVSFFSNRALNISPDRSKPKIGVAHYNPRILDWHLF